MALNPKTHSVIGVRFTNAADYNKIAKIATAERRALAEFCRNLILDNLPKAKTNGREPRR